MNLNIPIESAEIQYKQILEGFFASYYDEKSLPSHGIDHHRRVWNNAKEIMTRIPNPDSAYLPTPDKLIIACYLHDIGMSVDTGIRHGKHSRDLCLKFLSENNLDDNKYRDVLDAIEKHDDKNYTEATSSKNLLTILSAADDLDAFGFFGIYRYLEIYMARGISLDKIGYLIMDNAAGRFDHFVKSFGRVDSLLQKYEAEYEILNNFFNGYNAQIGSYVFGEKEPEEYCGVVEILIRLIKERKKLSEFKSEAIKYSNDRLIRWFFNGLQEEEIL